MSAEPVTLSVTGLSKSFGERHVLRDVCFEGRAGEVVAVIGQSGAGKTTLFRCLAGLTRPDSGAIRLGGHEWAGVRGRMNRDTRRRMALVFQQFNLVRRLSALENVLAGRLGYASLWRGALRRFSRDDRLLAIECLDRVGLLDYAHQRADTLSGGQQQRVAIARALAQRPAVILADEPVASLDPTASAGILELLRTIAISERVAVLCSLHQLHLAQEYADRVLALVDGRVLVDRPTSQLDEAALELAYRRP